MLVNKKGEQTMTYNKPELVLLDSAVKAIQSFIQKQSNSPDANSGPVHGTLTATSTAYEADE
jgi:hypothetical protein